MIHELKTLFTDFKKAREAGKRAVLATVVELEGSSYRRPGVRMLILDDNTMVGAVSGGCVEKAIRREAASVFKDGKAIMMTYDGRYRLGCEGVLYILIEPFQVEQEVEEAFWSAVRERQAVRIASQYLKDTSNDVPMGSWLINSGEYRPFANNLRKEESASVFSQELQPCNRLYILGAEHDAVALARTAADMGWEVIVIAAPEEEKELADFPGAEAIWSIQPAELGDHRFDSQTAVMVMSHNYARDVAYLHALREEQPAYIGILGPSKRREQVFSELLERAPDLDDRFLDRIHGPAGVDIGAETASEIAVSIMAEILTVFRNADLRFLKDKKGSIHSR